MHNSICYHSASAFHEGAEADAKWPGFQNLSCSSHFNVTQELRQVIAKIGRTRLSISTFMVVKLNRCWVPNAPQAQLRKF